ncbi:MAG TPA: zinc ribbon domain-containing protein [Myxococcaceae bacterium]
MPIYEYVCKQCGKLTDVLQKMNDPVSESCPDCGAKGPLEKVISRTSFVLKGGGWYSDLYGSSKKDANKKDAKKEGGGEASSGSGSSSGSGDKAAASSTASSGSASSSSPAPSAPAASASGDKK